MSKKNKAKNRKAVEQALAPREGEQRRPLKVVRDWETYFREGELEDWQRLMRDLGFDEEFLSKSQCRKVRVPP